MTGIEREEIYYIHVVCLLLGEGEFGYRGGKSYLIASSGVKTCSHSYKNEFDLQLEEDKFYTRYKQDADVKSI